MNFLAPAALGLAVLLPVIVAMYLLKLRRTEQVVPSVFLWRRTVRDVEANAPWQRLRRNLLLLLQLLFLLALILALARPFSWREGVGSQSAIFILDTSASMAATDVNPTRLEAVKAQAQQLVAGLPDGARTTVIAAGKGAEVLVSSSQDRRVAHQAIDGIQVTNGPGDLTAALQLASAIAARQPDTEIVVLSDGRVKLPDQLAVKGRVRYLPAGLNGENQAISLLSLEAAPGGSNLTAFIQVSNYGETGVNRRLELYAGGVLFNAYEVEVPARGQRAILAEDLPLETGLVEARLTDLNCPDRAPGEDCPPDILPLDDRAWAVHRETRPAAVTLVTEGSRFLETALALMPNLEITTVLPEDYQVPAASEQVTDLTIFDATVPITDTLPTGSLLFTGPPRSTGIFSVTGTVEQPAPRAAEANDPLLANVNLTGVNILDTAEIPLPGWARLVIVGDAGESDTPLLFAGELEGRRVAVLAFDLHHSDLPLQVAFPVLLANLTGWLAPSQQCLGQSAGLATDTVPAIGSSPCLGGGQLPAQVLPGETLAFQPPLDAGTITLGRPDGSRTRLEPAEGQVILGDLDQLGVYQLDWGNQARTYFAANLFLPSESDNRPAANLPLASDEPGEGGQVPQQARHEWWRSLAFMAMALLVVEWMVYQRATLIKMFRGIRLKS